MKLTEHFDFDEMTRTDHAEFQETNRAQAEGVLPALLATAQLLEQIRAWSGPILVHSGYRCPELNGAIPGHAVKAQHMLGQACDFSLAGEQTPAAIDSLFGLTHTFLKAHPEIRFGQLIRERLSGPGWVHLSLGCPWRDSSRCGEVMAMNQGGFTMLEKIG